MGKWCNDDVLDAAIDEIATNCNLMTICNAQPTTRAEAVTTYALADIAMAAADFATSNGVTSGRRLTIYRKDWIEIDVSDTATYIALVDGTRLLYTVPCTSTVVTAGEFRAVPEWHIEFRDPT